MHQIEKNANCSPLQEKNFSKLSQRLSEGAESKLEALRTLLDSGSLMIEFTYPKGGARFVFLLIYYQSPLCCNGEKSDKGTWSYEAESGYSPQG